MFDNWPVELLIQLTWNCMVILIVSYLFFFVKRKRLKTDEWLILTTSQIIRFISSAFSSVTLTPIIYHSAHDIHIQLENGHQCQYYTNIRNSSIVSGIQNSLKASIIIQKHINDVQLHQLLHLTIYTLYAVVEYI